MIAACWPGSLGSQDNFTAVRLQSRHFKTFPGADSAGNEPLIFMDSVSLAFFDRARLIVSYVRLSFVLDFTK